MLICYLACLCKYNLVAGETGIALCLAPDQTQAKIILDYCSANITNSKILSQQLVNVVKQTIELKGNIQIQVKASDYRTLRGPSYITAVLDESAFFYVEDSVNPDSEIVRAVTPALSTTGGMLVLSSSPYMKKGELHDRFRQSLRPRGRRPRNPGHPGTDPCHESRCCRSGLSTRRSRPTRWRRKRIWRRVPP